MTLIMRWWRVDLYLIFEVVSLRLRKFAEGAVNVRHGGGVAGCGACELHPEEGETVLDAFVALLHLGRVIAAYTLFHQLRLLLPLLVCNSRWRRRRFQYGGVRRRLLIRLVFIIWRGALCRDQLGGDWSEPSSCRPWSQC